MDEARRALDVCGRRPNSWPRWPPAPSGRSAGHAGRESLKGGPRRQRRVGEECSPQIGLRKSRAIEAGPREPRLPQISAVDDRVAQISAAQVGTAQIRSGQEHPGKPRGGSSNSKMRKGSPASSDTVAGRLPATAWQRQSAGNGAKGPRYYDWAWIHIGTGSHRHLLVRRNRSTGRTRLLPVLVTHRGAPFRSRPRRRCPLERRGALPGRQGPGRTRPLPTTDRRRTHRTAHEAALEY